MAIQVEVWGDYACFTRPEMKTERVSYDIMTPSAARGLLESIYWHPGFRWIIERIHVCSPIRFTNIRRNEVKDTISARKVKGVMEKGFGELYLAAPDSIQQRAAMVLRDVRYVIDAHFEMTDHARLGIILASSRILSSGDGTRPVLQHALPGYAGICRAFPALRGAAALPGELRGTQSLGWMLWDMDYSDPKNITPRFFRAVLTDGVLHVPQPGSEEVRA